MTVGRPLANVSLVSKIESAALRPSRSMAAVLEQMPVREAPQLRNWLLDPQVDVDRKDDALLQAVLLAAEAPDAAVLLTYCLLPGLSRLARRFRSFDQDEIWSELVTGLLDRVQRYDASRRPRRVAANLLLDALSATCRWTARESKANVIRLVEPGEPDFPDVSSLCPVAEGLRRGVVSAADAVLITSTRIHGASLGDIAALLGLRYEAAKKRRRRAELTLMRWWSDEDGAEQSADAA